MCLKTDQFEETAEKVILLQYFIKRFGKAIKKINDKIINAINYEKKTSEKKDTFYYRITKFDKEGWANAKKAKPIPFDMVTIETASGKRCPAWWNESLWEGLRLRKNDKILRWKRRVYVHVA